MPDPLRIAVIGGGAFGRNHLRVYSELAASGNRLTLSALVEPNPQSRAEIAAQYAIPAYASVTELLASRQGIDAASVCVPTLAHAMVATELLAAGLDVLIEKPITPTLAEADALIALANRLNRIVAVGHLERFNPAVTACFGRLTAPRFFEAHRLSVFTPRSLDVDVVLDLMIHDLDIVLALCASGIREVRAVGLPVLSHRVDIANARVEFQSGCIANFTASRVSTERIRKLRLFQPEQYLSLDFARQELLSIQLDPARVTDGHPEAQPQDPLLAPPHSSARPEPRVPSVLSSRPEPAARSGEIPVFPSASTAQLPQSFTHPSPGLSLEKITTAPAEPLRLELEDFLHAVRTRNPPRVSAQAARSALDLALAITDEIRSHARRADVYKT